MKKYLIGAVIFFFSCVVSKTAVQVNSILSDYDDCAILMKYEPVKMAVHLEIAGYLASGGGAGCEDFAEMVWRIIQIDERIVVHVRGPFVPSRVNPITFEDVRKMME